MVSGQNSWQERVEVALPAVEVAVPAVEVGPIVLCTKSLDCSCTVQSLRLWSSCT
eukprot:jgi/Botrbrau1/11918/Bobra.0259s0007.1